MTRALRAVAVAAAATALVATSLGVAPSMAAPSRSQLEQARARLYELEKDFELVVERYNAVHERSIGLQNKIAETDAEIRRLDERIAVEREAAVALATALYKAGPAATLDVVLSSESLSDMDARLEYLRSSGEAQGEVFARLEDLRARVDAKYATLDDARADAGRAESKLVELTTDIEAKMASQRAEIEQLTALIEAAERRAEARHRALAEASLLAIPVDDDFEPAPGPTPAARAAIEFALAQLGKPYEWGASGPDTYDCSGLTQSAWASAGVAIPRNSAMQFAGLRHVGSTEWAPGDLLFFGSPIHHVGMYLGKGKMVEAPYTGSHVRINSAHRPDYAGAVRPGV